MKRGRRGQIWVETVLYTLIGLAIIGIILAAATPKINCKKDTILIEQAIESMGKINEKVYEVQRAAGNRRAVDLTIGKGDLIFDLENDRLKWEISSSCIFSELDYPIPYGPMNVTTTSGDPYKVTIERDYAFNILYGNQTTGTYELMESSIPYNLLIENMGFQDGQIRVQFRVA